jgi:hypothetical protein
VLVERDGRATAKVISRVSAKELKDNIVASVEHGTDIHSDEHRAYRGIHHLTGGAHRTVTHNRGEYARGSVHVNTAESWNALLKRSIVGSFHHVSREHLSRYCDEVSFRWDRREITDSERTAAAVKNGEGKRLTYRPAGPPQ